MAYPSWEAGFAGLTCAEARPGGATVDPFKPSDIAEVIASSCQRGNSGHAQALLRLRDGRWAAMDVSTDDTCGQFWVHSSRGYLSEQLSDVVLYGLDESGRDHLAIPNGVEQALDWVHAVEAGNVTSLSRLYSLLPATPWCWRDIFDELAALAEEQPRSRFAVSGFSYTEVTGVAASRLTIEGDTGWAAAVLRLRDRRWATIASTIDLTPARSGRPIRIEPSPPVKNRSLAAAAWQGLTATHRAAMGLPSDPAAFRAWAQAIEKTFNRSANGSGSDH